MRVIKCAGKNRQAILDDAKPVIEAKRHEPPSISYNAYKNSDGSRHYRPSAGKTPFEDNLEYHIRSNNAFYVHLTPANDSVDAEICYFMQWQDLYRKYDFRIPDSDTEWFTATKK